MKTLAYLLALATAASSAALAQNVNPQSDSARQPQARGASTIPGNRDPGARAVAVPSDNPGTTSVDRSAIEAPRTSNQESDRTISREWQGLGSTGGGTGTGTSSGTSADETAPGQDGNRPEQAGTRKPQDTDTDMRKNATEPARQ